jgi:hypothetical protein
VLLRPGEPVNAIGEAGWFVPREVARQEPRARRVGRLSRAFCFTPFGTFVSSCRRLFPNTLGGI